MVSLPFPMGSTRLATLGALSASSIGTAVASHASDNTKGAWVEFSASTPFDAVGVLMFFSLPGPAGRLIDLGVGGAGSEVVVVENILRTVGGTFSADHIFLPIAIPQGSRLALRQQSTTGSHVSEVTLMLVAGNFAHSSGFHRATTYGAATADSGGVSVDPGGTINTKGAYSEIAAATARAAKSVLLLIGNWANTAMSNAAWLIDIAVGAAGSEVVVAADVFVTSFTGSDSIVPGAILLPISIPAGARLAVRAQCNSNDATDRLLDAVIIGFG